MAAFPALADASTKQKDLLSQEKSALKGSLPCAPPSSAGLEGELDRIIAERNLRPWFQPIVDLQKGQIIGYEALIRGPSDSPLHSPMALFDTAIRCDRIVELELLCRNVNIEFFAKQRLQGRLFLNISPTTLVQPDFPRGFTKKTLERYGLNPSHVVIELTEQFPIDDFDLIRTALAHYRQMGFTVALDDLGSAYAGLRLWSELVPDFVKFDKHFIQGINEDRTKQKFIKSFLEVAEGLGCQAIAEGIETQQECQLLQAYGLRFGQGYYFARPSANPPATLSATLCFRSAGLDRESSLLGWRTETVAGLVKNIPTVEPETSLNEVSDLFEKLPDLWSLPVLTGDRPVGIVRRYEIMNILANRFGRDLYGRHPIAKFMDPNPLIIEESMPVEKLSQIITDESSLHLGNHFIITAKEKYRGVGTIVDLLRNITELQVRNARYANPLTLLPGNVPISEKVESLLLSGEPFTLAHFDLDNFKPFNDCYGYSRGDLVIGMLAHILVESVHGDRDFVGHVGGDDFIVVFRSANWQTICQEILVTFAQEICNFYDPAHVKQGGIWTRDRRGNRVFQSFCSLSIGAVPCEQSTACCHHEISTKAAEAKKQAKKIAGNSLFVERRGCVSPQD